MEISKEEAQAVFDAEFSAVEDSTIAADLSEEIPDEPAAVVEEPKVEEKKEEEADPWAGVPDVVKKRLYELENSKSELEQRLRSAEGRVGKMQNEFAAAQAAAKNASESPTQGQMQKAAASPEKWNQLKEDFPEWAEGIEARLSAINFQAPDMTPLKSEIDVLKTALGERDKAFSDTVEALESIRVELKHKGWQEKVKTPEFISWFQSQSPDVQAKGASSKSKDAIEVLDSYETFLNAPKAADINAERKKRLQTAAAVKTTPASSGETGDMTAEELWNKTLKQVYKT